MASYTCEELQAARLATSEILFKARKARQRVAGAAPEAGEEVPDLNSSLQGCLSNNRERFHEDRLRMAIALE